MTITYAESTLPTGWGLGTIKEIAELVVDGDHNPPKRVPSGIPHLTAKNIKHGNIVFDGCSFISMEGFEQTKNRYEPKPGDLVITCVGTIGECAIVRGGVEFSADRNLAAIRLKDGLLDARLLFHYLQKSSVQSHLRSTSGSTAQPHLYLKDIRGLEVTIPPVEEQRRILTKLEELFSELDAGVASLRRAQRRLTRYRQALLQAAVTGELTREWREQTDHLTPVVLLAMVEGRHTKKRAAEECQETQSYPNIPDHWAWSSLGQLAARVPNAITDGPFGSNLKTAHYTSSGPRVIRLQNIGDGKFVDAKAHISHDHFENLKKHSVLANDLLIAALGESLPRACVTPLQVGPAIVKADCIRMRTDSRFVIPEYLCVALNAEPTRKRTSKRIHGVGRPRLNLGEIKEIQVPIPSLPEQRAILEELDRRLSAVEVMESSIQTSLRRAERLRQSILERAFRGELVPQDPHDEPASTFLNKNQTKAEPATPARRGRPRKKVMA